MWDADFQVQLERLTEQFQTVTEEMQRRFAVDGESLVSAGHLSASASPMAGGCLSPLRAPTAAAFRTQAGFDAPAGNQRSISCSGAFLMSSLVIDTIDTLPHRRINVCCVVPLK